MIYFPVELHTHTNHSDGDFTVEELIQNAIDFGYKALIMTDHNTSSGFYEAIDKEFDKKILIMKGMEWTTYFGHMLALDADEIVDWRCAAVNNIDQYIDRIKQVNGLVGIAHPYAVGSPMCTGCHWDFKVDNWANIDYIEIWNSGMPDKIFWNDLAYELWTNLLKEGYHISCASGRDWHKMEGSNVNTPVTYIGVTGELSLSSMKDALRKGSMYVSLGPKVEIVIEKDGLQFFLGDTVPSGEGILKVRILETEIRTLKIFNFSVDEVRVISKENIIFESYCNSIHDELSIPVTLERGYIRVELLGTGKGDDNLKLIITNPIYIN